MTDAEPISPSFLDRLRRRDPATMAEAIREHAQPLFRSARALGCTASEAEDLVQDVFVTFLERIDSFEGRSQLRTWLFGVLHRKMHERRRASAKIRVNNIRAARLRHGDGSRRQCQQRNELGGIIVEFGSHSLEMKHDLVCFHNDAFC